MPRVGPHERVPGMLNAHTATPTLLHHNIYELVAPRHRSVWPPVRYEAGPGVLDRENLVGDAVSCEHHSLVAILNCKRNTSRGVP